MNKRLLILLLLSLSQSLAAQDISDSVNSDLRRYTVELIVFEYAQSVGTGTETFVADNGLQPAELRIRPLQRGKTERTRLRDEELTLKDTFRRLQRLDVYRPIMHFGWTQTLLPNAEILPQPLASYGPPPPGLDGELRLYLSRYLHLDLNIAMAANSGNSDAMQESQRDAVFHRIREDRIVRDGEIRYFDHPKFGVIAKVTKIDLAQKNNPDDQGETEFLGDS